MIMNLLPVSSVSGGRRCNAIKGRYRQRDIAGKSPRGKPLVKRRRLALGLTAQDRKRAYYGRTVAGPHRAARLTSD